VNLTSLNAVFLSHLESVGIAIQLEDVNMAEAASKVPVKTEEKAPAATSLEAWRPFESLRHEIDRLFEDFDRGFWTSPFRRTRLSLEPLWRGEPTWKVPAVDVVDTEKAYKISAELPGLDEKDVEVKLANRNLTIKGEKQEEKEEKQKDYYLHERRFGSFERSFEVPDEVDADKIEASFKKGVLTVTLPKKPEAVKPEKKIEVKAA
jgi:HSP20 family protein